MNVNLSIAAHGRFKLIKHTGHKFDDSGKVIEYGQVLHETPFTDNVFTNVGCAAYLSAGGVPLTAVLSTSSTPPTIGGVSAAATRISTTLVDVATTRQNVPDEDGLLHWRITYRFTFPATGGAPSTISIKQLAISSPSFGYLSASLVKDQDGNPSGVVLDQDEEYIDLVWEFNEYIPAEQSGTVVAGYVSGGSVYSTVSHNWVMKPANFTNVADDDKGWAPIETNQLPHITLDADLIWAGSGIIGYPETAPIFDESFNPSSIGLIYAQWGFESVAAEGFNVAQFMLGHTEWQISFDPPIEKTSNQFLRIDLSINVTSRG